MDTDLYFWQQILQNVTKTTKFEEDPKRCLFMTVRRSLQGRLQYAIQQDTWEWKKKCMKQYQMIRTLKTYGSRWSLGKEEVQEEHAKLKRFQQALKDRKKYEKLQSHYESMSITSLKRKRLTN